MRWLCWRSLRSACISCFFLHITTGPDNVNNVLALAFGVLIVFLIIVGSLWIMYNMNQNVGPDAHADGIAFWADRAALRTARLDLTEPSSAA